MRTRIALLAVAALALTTVAVLPSAQAASASYARTTFTFTATHIRINANTRPSFTYAISGAPRGATFKLQRPEGTKAVWRSIKLLVTRKGTVAAPKVDLGEYHYRVAVFKNRALVAHSRSRTIFAYGKVSLKTLCLNASIYYSCDGGNQQVGSNLWSYQVTMQGAPYPSFSDNIDFPKTSCRSLTVNFAAEESMQQDGGRYWVKVLQTATDAAVSSAPTGRIGTLTTRLDGGPFRIDAAVHDNSIGGYWDVHGAGSALCYTSSGKR